MSFGNIEEISNKNNSLYENDIEEKYDIMKDEYQNSGGQENQQLNLLKNDSFAENEHQLKEAKLQ